MTGTLLLVCGAGLLTSAVAMALTALVARARGTVSVVDVRKLELVRQVQVGGQPLSVAYSSLARLAYVSDGKGGVVCVLGVNDAKPIKRIALKPGLGPLRFTPDERHAMVVNTHEDLVHVIDASSNEAIHDIAVKGQPFQVTFTRGFAYVRALASERVTISRVSSLSSVRAATRAIASRAAERIGSASTRQRSIARAMREASCGLKLSISTTLSAQNT